MPGPFDFSDQDQADDTAGYDPAYAARLRARRMGQPSKGGMILMLILQAFFLALAICFFPFLIVVAMLQIGAAVMVAMDLRGRGSEAAVWALMMLFFPVVGPMIYLVAV